jgi:hypothetical protein
MSHDHLQYDHRMMHRHDTNRMDGMNLGAMNPDERMMIHHVTHRKKVCPKMDDQKMI